MRKFSAIIAFRTTEEEKKAFQDACDNSCVTPSKYVAGNVLRKFINAYCQNPRYFENLFNKFVK